MLDASRGPFEPFWGHVEELTLETPSPVASKVVPLRKPCPASAKMPPKRAYVGSSWGYVGPSAVYVGAMFAHLGAMSGLCWPPEVILELCCFHEFTFIPKICLKKLSPVACEAPTAFLQHHFFEKAQSCLGREHPWWAPESSHQWPARCQKTRKCLLNGLMLAHLGAMLVHLRSMLGPCSPILGLCWGYVDPRRWFWSYVVFMSSPSFPKFAWKSSPQWPARHPLHFCNTIFLKKLNPAWDGRTPDERLKALTSGLRGSRKCFPRVGKKVGGAR